MHVKCRITAFDSNLNFNALGRGGTRPNAADHGCGLTFGGGSGVCRVGARPRAGPDGPGMGGEKAAKVERSGLRPANALFEEVRMLQPGELDRKAFLEVT